MSVVDIKCLMVASLLHDLGHYPLCHDIEDFILDDEKDIFNHINIGERFILSSLKDSRGRALRDIIEDPMTGWGINSVEGVIDIIRETKKLSSPQTLFDGRANTKAQLLANIISGDIDADKLDYLIRDSHYCGLVYGKSIDVSRLVRTLTTSIHNRVTSEDSEKTERALEIAIYEKGKSAAEVVGFTRYLMFQAVYWHHTSRAIKAMIKKVVDTVLAEARSDAKKKKAFTDKFFALLGLLPSKDDEVGLDIGVSPELILDFLADRGTEVSKELVKLLKQRRLYKRILTVHRVTETVKGRRSDYDNLRDHYKEFCPVFQKRLLAEFDRLREKHRESTTCPDDTGVELVHSLLSGDHSILIDVPDAKYGSQLSLCIIPELESLKRNYDAKMHASKIMGDIWQNVYSSLMYSVCKARIYCHPAARDVITSILGYEELRRVFRASMDEVTSKMS